MQTTTRWAHFQYERSYLAYPHPTLPYPTLPYPTLTHIPQIPSWNCSNPIIANASAALITRGLLRENSNVDGELLLLDGVQVSDNYNGTAYWVQSLKVHDDYNLT